MRIVIIITFILVPFFLTAQQRPQYTQYIMNQYILNPALSGIENHADARLSYRQQWAGLEGAPVTIYFTAHKPIGIQNNPVTGLTTISDAEETNNIGSQSYSDLEFKNHHGIGMQIINDKIGPFNQTNINITYAYHLAINTKVRLSSGTSVGFSRQSLNTNSLNFGSINPSDPSVGSTSTTMAKNNFNLSAGLWLYSSNFFLGASAQQLAPVTIDYSEGAIIGSKNRKLLPHFFFTGGYKLPINEDFAIVPSFMLKKVDPLPIQGEANVKALYKNSIWAGGTYRFKYGFAALAGISIMSNIDVTYSYDYSTTSLNKVSNGTHEVQFGFLLKTKYSNTKCPKNIW